MIILSFRPLRPLFQLLQLAPLVALVALVSCGKVSSQEGPPDGGAVVEGGTTPAGPGRVVTTCPRTPAAQTIACSSVADCSHYGWPNPRCIPYDGGAALYCDFDQCSSDSDCASNQACTCSTEGRPSLANQCDHAECHVNADCPATGVCAMSEGQGAGQGFFGAHGWYCHTPGDTCRTDADCPTGNVCSYIPTSGKWGCGQGVAG
jgi:hypothetical protein